MTRYITAITAVLPTNPTSAANKQEYPHAYLVAGCSDGTNWYINFDIDQPEWVEFPAIPQPEKAPEKAKGYKFFPGDIVEVMDSILSSSSPFRGDFFEVLSISDVGVVEVRNITRAPYGVYSFQETQLRKVQGV